jgi:hypothetical protein
MVLEITAPEAQPVDCDELCTLPDDARRDRSRMIRSLIFPHVTRREALANGWALEFDYNPAVEKTLDDLVAFERGCCGALMWTLARPSQRVLRLSIEGLPPDSPLFLEIGGARSERSG